MVEKFTVNTAVRMKMVDVTEQVRDAVKKSGVRSGICYIQVPHTSAAVVVNEGHDPAVAGDLMNHLDKLVPWGAAYEHQTGNSAAHIKASLVGPTAEVFVEDGDLLLGSFQGVFLCEFDGPRERELWVKVLG